MGLPRSRAELSAFVPTGLDGSPYTRDSRPGEAMRQEMTSHEKEKG
jgi:hypothetical protein